MKNSTKSKSYNAKTIVQNTKTTANLFHVLDLDILETEFTTRYYKYNPSIQWLVPLNQASVSVWLAPGILPWCITSNTLQWRHDDHDSVSNHQPHGWPVNFPHKWPVTRKMFSFDDVIMSLEYCMYWICFSPTCSYTLVCFEHWFFLG